MSEPEPEPNLEDYDPDAPLQVPQMWPKFLFGGLILALLLGGVWYFLLRTATKPNQVIIAVRVIDEDGNSEYWWDENPAAMALVEKFKLQLEELGFDSADLNTASLSELKGAHDLEALRSKASKMEAGFIVVGTARIQHTVPLDGELNDYSIELLLAIYDVETGEETAAPGMPLEFFEWGRSADEAVADASERMAAAATAPLAEVFSHHPKLERLKMENRELSYDEAALANGFEPLFRVAGHYRNQVKQRDDDEKNAQLTYEAVEKSPLTRERLGDFLADENYVGAGPGDELVLMTEPHYVDIRPDEGHYSIRRESERLVLSNGVGAERRMLFEHFNFFSFPSISADGSVIAAVIDNRQRSKWLVTVSVPSGEFKLLLAHTDHYFSSPVVSPNGSRVAFFYRTGRNAASALETIDVGGRERRTLINPGLSLSLPSWSPNSETLYVAVGVGRRDSIAAIDLVSGEQRFLLGPETRPQPEAVEPEDTPDALAPMVDADGLAPQDGEQEPALAAPDEPWDPRRDSIFDQPLASPDGTFLIVKELDGARVYIGRYGLASGAYVRLAELDLDAIQLSPTGDFVAGMTRAFEHQDDPGSNDVEVVILSTAPGGEPIPVTLNAVDDVLGGWSRDGRSVFVRQDSQDPASRRFSSRVYRYHLATTP
ncbi:MAG: hypothetical protein COW42_16570 [Deltaproteobacteria bacterium CG17_big_fil_post_rev_8_21_14_2_50_63_7]|nr:MAG: hypothetical protein COW42_16570 [Deltaproteobacteria bacterium CG17_big_fil_post_rev_8_21_14_2_50_63_7]